MTNSNSAPVKPDSETPSDSASSNDPSRPGREPHRMPWWMFLTLISGTALGVVWYVRNGDPVTASSIGLVALSSWIGFKMGFGQILASVTALTAAIFFAPSIGMNYESWFSEKFGSTGLTNRVLCIATVGVLISLVTTCLLMIAFNAFLSRRKKLGRFNHFAGFGVGLVEGGVMVLLVLGAALSFQLWQRDAPVANNPYADFLEDVASKTRESAIGDLVRDNNPFERFEMLAQTKQIHQTVQNLQDGQNIERVLRDPKITELQSDPEFKTAIETLRQDKDVRDFLREGRPLDRAMTLRLMSHPAVLRLLDQEEFMQRAKEILESI